MLVMRRKQWLTLHRWFAGEAERIQGTVSTPSAPGRRLFTIKQPIGVAVALCPWNFPIVFHPKYHTLTPTELC
jgi:acyl-CoA reductase-like NAD-dependent aldehyde dehydrogenase